MVNFDNFLGLTSMLKFNIFLIFNCEELVRIRAICEGLVRFFSDVKNWYYSIFANVKNRYQFFTSVNFHKCDESVPNAHRCEKLVPNAHICEKLVPNYHRCEELVLNLHRCQ